MTDTMSSMSSTTSCDEQAKLRAELLNAAVGSLDKQDGFYCEICKNKGVFAYPTLTDMGYSTVLFRECVCMKQRRSLRRLEKSGLKSLLKDYTFDSFKAYDPWQGLLLRAAKCYTVSPEGWFYIGGQVGSGKTHICTAICGELLSKGYGVVYMLWRDAAVQLKACVNDEQQYMKLISEYKNAEVLYIDDLFKAGRDSRTGAASAPTPADINLAFEILNYRYNDSSKLTILSSEYSISDIITLDEALGSRIYERTKGGTAFAVKRGRERNYRLSSQRGED